MPRSSDSDRFTNGDGHVPSPSRVAARGVLEPADPGSLADADAARAAQRAETMGFGRWVLELATIVAVSLVLWTGIRTYLVQPFLIPSTSMEPTLLVDDRVFVAMSAYRLEPPRPGDVVVFVSPDDGATDLIKRVIAVAGQRVDVRDGVVYVDGAALREPYVNAAYPDSSSLDGTITVPAGTIWVMGDNRANSRDSRVIGPQPVSRVLGRAFAIYWPLGRARWL